MKITKVIQKFEKRFLREDNFDLNIGNTIRIGVVIREGEKERTQFFEGIIISKNNSPINTMITVRRKSQGIGIERTFPIYSPQVKSIKVLDYSRAKRSKLFYLRNKVGKAAIKIRGK